MISYLFNHGVYLLSMEALGILLAGIIPAIVFGLLAYLFLYKKTRLTASKAILAAMLGIISAIPAYYFQAWLESTMDPDYTIWWQAAIVAFLIVALIEETVKTTMLWLSNYLVPIDEPMDLLAISVIIAMGFAGVENVLYSHNLGWEVALFRSLTAVPAHAFFAVIIGYFTAMSFPDRKKIKPYLQGLFIAFLFHGFYDFFIIQEFSEYLMLGALVVLLISGALVYNAYKRTKNHSSN